ncbi:MAG TPA: CvpA family protein [Acidobacteriaceae bacterium]|nr:CvpA family protein [Acidobacteriaceae bacterium]
MSYLSYTQWNVFDWFLVAIAVVSVAMAVRSGLVRAVFGLIGLIGGFQIATWCYVEVGDWISPTRLAWPTAARRTMGFLAVVALVTVGLQLAGWCVQKFLRKMGMGPMDRLLGAAFGFARGCMIGLAVLMAAAIVAPQSEMITTSVLTPYLFAVAHDVSFLVPQYLQQQMVDGAFDFKHNPPHWINPS